MAEGEDFPTRTDRFYGGRLLLRQPARGYRAGIDPILLAASVPAAAGDTVLDVGCGVGTAGLCLLARRGDVSVTALELQPALAALARTNAEDNGLADRLSVVEGDLLCPPEALRGRHFDHVVTNPPWHPATATRRPATASKSIGHVEGAAGLEEWLRAAARFVGPHGTLSVIHRADRLGDLLSGLAGRGLGEVRVLPLWPKAGQAAGRVVVRARRGSRAPLELLPGLVLHDEDGRYTAQADDVLRGSSTLP